MNRLTNTEADEAVAASFDSYDDRALDRPSKADLVAEAEWWRHFKARTDAGIEDIDPHGFPEEARPRLLDALRIAVAEVTCQGCGQRGHENACDHGKNICPGCWPDKCWGCNAEASDAEETW